jgi:shikimate kinase
MVVALGGGAFAHDANRALLEENGVTIWLDCPFPTVCRRIGDTSHRPLARDPKKFQELYDERRAPYSKAEYRVEINSDDPAEVVAEILRLPIFQ